MERKITVVVAEMDFKENDDSYGGYSCEEFNIKSYSIEELLKEDWFLKYLDQNGFVNKQDPDLQFTHSKRFLYLTSYCNDTYSNYTHELPPYRHGYRLNGVYQEVIGNELSQKIKEYKDKETEWDKKERKRVAKRIENSKINKEKNRLRKIERAKKLLETLEDK